MVKTTGNNYVQRMWSTAGIQNMFSCPSMSWHHIIHIFVQAHQLYEIIFTYQVQDTWWWKLHTRLRQVQFFDQWERSEPWSLTILLSDWCAFNVKDALFACMFYIRVNRCFSGRGANGREVDPELCSYCSLLGLTLLYPMLLVVRMMYIRFRRQCNQKCCLHAPN